MPSGFYSGPVPDNGVGQMGQNIGKVVSQIGGIFQERYSQKQYQDFLDGPQKDYESALHSVNDLLLDETNPEGPAQAVKMMSSALSTYMDQAGRYKNNPYIANRAAQAFQGNQQMLNELFVTRMGMQKETQATITNALGQSAKSASIGETQARTGLISAQTDALKSGLIGVTPSGKLGKATGTKGTKGGPAFLTGGPGFIDPNNPPDAQVDQAYAAASANLSNPGSAAEQKARASEMDGIRRSLAQQDVAARASRGEQRDYFDPKTGITSQEPWDATNEKHIAEAEKLVDPEDVKNRYIYSKMKEESPLTMPGVNPGLIDQKYGWLKDPDLANPNAPVTREMSEASVGKVLLGADGWNALTDPTSKKQPLDLTEAAQRLPDDYTKLQGPLRKGIDAAVGAIVTGTVKPKNASEVRQLISGALKAVAGEYIGGGHPNDKVGQGVLKSRYAAAKFSDAIANKYAQTLAQKLGIEKPQAPADQPGGLHISTEWLKENTPVGDLENILTGAKGYLGNLKD